MRYTALLILVSALLNAGMMVAGRGGFIHTVAVLAAGIYVGLPALIMVGCGYLLGNRFSWARQVMRIAVVVFVLSASFFISLIPGRALVKHDIVAAKTYCESLIPAIDKYRRQNGVYPLEISTVAQDKVVPRLLRSTRFYWSDGQTYRFNFGDPRGMMNFVGYNSLTLHWEEWH